MSRFATLALSSRARGQPFTPFSRNSLTERRRRVKRRLLRDVPVLFAFLLPPIGSKPGRPSFSDCSAMAPLAGLLPSSLYDNENKFVNPLSAGSVTAVSSRAAQLANGDTSLAQKFLQVYFPHLRNEAFENWKLFYILDASALADAAVD